MVESCPSELRHSKVLAFIIIAVSLLFSLSLIEDAFIPLRVVNQFFDGNGLAWNMGERVQVSTSLPWQILLLPLGFADPVKGLAILAFFLSLISVWLTLKMCDDFPALVAVTAGWVLSSAIKLYLVSGLETPLVGLVLCLCVFFWKRNPWAWAFFVGFLPAIRHDLVTLALPLALAGAYTIFKKPRVLWLMILPGLINLIFSLFYFGSPFPNTAYAKLGANIPFSEIMASGTEYLSRSFQLDPSLWILVVVAGWMLFRRDRRLSLAVLGGGLLSGLYAWLLASDYMLGRFLVPAGILSIACLASCKINLRESSVIVLLLLSGFLITEIRGNGPVSDLRFLKPQDLPSVPLGRLFSEDPFRGFEWAETGKRLQPNDRTLQGSIGIMGYFSPNSHYIKDFLALADPILARLPSPYKLDWRPGHYDRAIPEGSWDWDMGGDGRSFKDPEIVALASMVKSAHRDPLFSKNRLSNIVSLCFWRPSSKLRFESTYPNAIKLTSAAQKILPGQYGVIRGPGVIEVRGRFVLDRVKDGRRLERKFLGGGEVGDGPWNLFYIPSEDSEYVIMTNDPNGCTFEGFISSIGSPISLRIPTGNGDSGIQRKWVTIEKGSFVMSPRHLKLPSETSTSSYRVQFYPDSGQTIEINSEGSRQKVQNGGVVTISGDDIFLRSQERVPLEYISLIPIGTQKTTER